MKCAQWQGCSKVSIDSEILNLREVEANLVDLMSAVYDDAFTAGQIAIALSFLRDASQALLHQNSDAEAHS